ncbi:MAG: hypothetical protein ACTTJ7_08140 [Treponema sp.]
MNILKNILHVKKAIIIIMLSCTLLSLVWAQDDALAALSEKYPSAKEMSMIDTYGSYGLWMIIYEPNWSSRAVVYNSVSKTITEFTIDEMSVYSAKIIRTKNNTMIEIIGQTHMGNGFVYLFTFEKELLFQHYILDVHHDSMDYAEFRRIEQFKNIPYRSGERFSRIFKNDVLKIDYSHFDTGRIRIYGTVLYISEWDKTTTVLAQLEVERIYQYNSSSRRYELIKKTGSLYEREDTLGLSF